MGCVTATAKRRRKQAKMGWKNLPPMTRPRIKVRTLDASQRREARDKERRAALMARKGKKKA